MPPSLRAIRLAVARIVEGREPRTALEDHGSAAPPVASVGSAARHELLAAEGHAACSAIARLHRDAALVGGVRFVLDAGGDDDQLARGNGFLPLPEIHAKSALDDQEHLVGVIVLVPDELARDLDQLDLIAVELADHLGAPMIGEASELLGQIDLIHGSSPCPPTTASPAGIR